MQEFQVNGKIHITDPCYDIKTWCGIYNQKAKKGAWVGEAIQSEEDYSRVGELVVNHKDFHGSIDTPISGDVGVDSGQAGVFDSSIYPKQGEPNGEASDKESFYGKCCRETCSGFDKEHDKLKIEKGLQADNGVVDERGFVSSSGYGDGSYEAFGAYEDGELVAVRIVFIDDSEEDEDGGDDEDHSSE